MIDSLAIVIPIYKQRLNLLEQFSLDYLLTIAIGRKLFFVAPRSVNTDYYRQRYSTIQYSFHDDHFFSSIAGYNKLLIDKRFYEAFSSFKYILIHQTDALLLKDNLDDWSDLGYDYIGAPWPMAMILNLEPDHPFKRAGQRFEAFVGNGGFSLRSVARSIAIIQQAKELHSFWSERGLNEDCFFAFAQVLGESFSIPPVELASKFALEVNPRQYFESNNRQLPTGCHAWWKYDFAFWQEQVPELRSLELSNMQACDQTSVPPHQQQIAIYCDGGFANRLNTLVSGLSLAHHFNIEVQIYWPRNNWCQAGFSDIFADKLNVCEASLSDLADSLAQFIPLLHDQKGADVLDVTFHSAYAYTSLDHFDAEAIATGRDIFYYPALIPQWLPMNMVAAVLQECHYLPHIIDNVAAFVSQTIGKPFHGLHLRRTDLNVGYSDDEVQAIVRQHPDEHFFVCSDDPIAEALAAVHANVHRRDKSAYVGKRNAQGDWMALTADDDGRMYHSNIDRNADSVVDAVIDMLILAHSSIVGFSGSTFQNMARLYGTHAPVVILAKPDKQIDFLSLSSSTRMLQTGNLTLSDCVGQCIELYNQGRQSTAIALAKLAIERAESHGIRDINTFLLHYNLGAHLLNDGHPYEASLYAEKAKALMPDSIEANTLLDMSHKLVGRPR